MPMREECKHFQSRTYRSGEVARWCVLDLAPEAPWRCPADCSRYERRLADVSWTYGSLAGRPTPDEPARLGEPVAALLDEAEDIVNRAGPEIVSEISRERRRSRAGWWERLVARRRRPA